VAQRRRSTAHQVPKLAKLMDGAEADVLAYMGFPKAHTKQIHTTNPLERLNAEIKRRTDVVGIFPNEGAITRLVGALLLEQSDEWALQHRYMQLEGLQTLSDNQPARLSAVVRGARVQPSQNSALIHHALGHGLNNRWLGARGPRSEGPLNIQPRTWSVPVTCGLP
jgi:hypothetical protein